MVVNRRAKDTGFRAVLFDTKTGISVGGEVPMLSPSWGLRLNQAGTVSISIPVRAKEARGMDLRNSTATLRQGLGMTYNGVPLEAGPILDREFDDESGQLTLTAAGLWSVFARRKAVTGAMLAALTSAGVTTKTLKIGPTSLQSIARELVRVSIQDNPFTGAGALNVVLPPVVAGAETKTYTGYDLKWIGDALKDLTELENGPDLRFRPRFMTDQPTRLEWVLETGNESQPLLTQPGPALRLDGTVPDSPVAGFGSKEDATNVGARAWRPGAGQERDMRLGFATSTRLTDTGMPWTEIENASKEEESTAVLNRQAAYDVRNAAGPEVQFTVRLRANHPGAMLGTYWPGDFADVVIPEDHPTLNPGLQRVRIMAIDGSDARTVNLTVAPFIGSYDGPVTPAGDYQRRGGTPPLTTSPQLATDDDLTPAI
ncbi:minor tail protein [Arthrobacter phage Shambre1]|uniref:Minor tail protein n=1 Tax=Arthrobacter phage Shambre1 TaxID=2927284 RepID=A0A977KPY6_9CAUD|nr:minor tail protein [Arthrobacter phage Shambre1]UXE04756.1 minor tail protein [Arthrobacter phage Shambre1]